MTTKKKLFLNTTFSMANQIITIVCGFILPRLFLSSYGSKVNGLVSSVTQFLGFITLAELGVGAVVQSALYKPLAEKNEEKISKIIVSSEKFFKKIILIFTLYVLILMVVYPLIIQNKFSYLYTVTLIFAISISLFAQYFFNISYKLLLNADQLGFIQIGIQGASLILNTIMSVILMQMGFSVQIVKLTSSIIFLMQPIFIGSYVKRNYNLNKNVVYRGEPIKQKWNGMAQHVASVVLNNTDIAVLTFFSTLENISIYYVYYLVVNGVKSLYTSLTTGFQSLMGELWAKQEIFKLNSLFGWLEWGMHTLSVIIFGCTVSLILPFISVYTKGVTDVNYILPEFALLITVAFAAPCIRLPYHLLILAAGHYKQTQSNHIWAAIMNIVISILFVKSYGLVGVAIGTICAVFYQTIWMAFYTSKNLIRWEKKYFIKQIIVDTLTFIIGYFLCKLLPMYCENYLEWIVLAIEVLLIWVCLVFFINLIFYKDRVKNVLIKINKVLKKLKNKQEK